jgi:hypothetical protein
MQAQRNTCKTLFYTLSFIAGGHGKLWLVPSRDYIQNPRLGNSDPTMHSLRVLAFYSWLGAYGMTPEERARLEYLCNRITVEKNSLKLEKLSLELNDLVSATLKNVQQKPKPKATQS